MTFPRWIRAWTILTLLLISLPYMAGWLFTPEGKTFTGNLQNFEDANAYHAYMNRGAAGDIFHIIPYNPVKTKPIPIFPLYILPGHLHRILGLSIPLIFHLMRLSYGGIFILTSYSFVRRILPDEPEQKLAMFILLFTAGLGWISIILIGGDEGGYHPNLVPDMWRMEATGFGSLISSPHFTLSIALMIGLLLLARQSIREGDRKSGIASALLGALLAATHPHHLATVGVVLAIIYGWQGHQVQWRALIRLGVIMLPAVLISLWLVWAIRQDEILTYWSTHTANPTPMPTWGIYLTFGLTLILALLGTAYVIKTDHEYMRMAVLWFVGLLVVLHLPSESRWRFVEGWHVPMAILAAVGWYRGVLPRLGLWVSPRLSTAGLALFLSMSTIFIFCILLVRITWKTDGDVFMDEADIAAAEWLDDHAPANSVVLASYDTGNRLPARAAVQVYAGHWAVTFHRAQRVAMINQFLSTMSDAERIDLLRENSIDYLYYGMEEQPLGTFSPEQAEYLEPVYSNAEVTIYTVSLP